MNIFFKKLDPLAILPQYAHEGDSGFDLFALEGGTILPGTTKVFRTGLAVELPEPIRIEIASFPHNAITMTFEMQIRSKSGRAAKEGLFVVNSPGTVDSGYRGEICVILALVISKSVFISPGEKIAQGVIVPVICAPEIQLIEVSELMNTERGSDGFGSTGLRKNNEDDERPPPAYGKIRG